MDYNSRATKLETLSREDLKRAAKILKLKGYGNVSNKFYSFSLIINLKIMITHLLYFLFEFSTTLIRLIGGFTSSYCWFLACNFV